MKHLLILFAVCWLSSPVQAQLYEKIWMFGESNSMDFSGSSPVPGGIPSTGGDPPQWYFHRSGAVCNVTGQLEFWVKLQYLNIPNGANIPNVFDRNGDPMPNGNLLTNYPSNGVPVFVPFDNDTNRYYIFYIKNGALVYSIVDMSLNGGKGDIIAASKNTFISGWNSVIDLKMVAVRGCRGVWIVCRSRTSNEFYSYEITKDGVSSSPVISACGSLPINWYTSGVGNGSQDYYPRDGVLKASPDGRKLALATNASGMAMNSGKGGIEIFDFEPCSGKVSNSLLLATGSYYGACFSPDNSKLYTTAIYERNLYQYDLSLPATPAIIASKTLILTNPTYNAYDESWLLGDAKRGLDGKIYLGNYNCDRASSHAMHIIENPNLPGLACTPIINGLGLGPNRGCTGFNLPADIVTFPHQDTTYGPTTFNVSCFEDQAELNAISKGHCYQWTDTVSGQTRTVTTPGTYVCTYTDDNCMLHIDTFKVHFPGLPVQSAKSFTCPAGSNGKMVFKNNDTSTLVYEWLNSNGDVIRKKQTNSGDTISGLDTGIYSIRFTTISGCSKMLSFRVEALPQPEAGFDLPDVACIDQEINVKNTSAAPLIKYYSKYDSSNQKDFTHTFYDAGSQYITQVVMNLEGCRDTLTKYVSVRDFRVLLLANENVFNKNDLVQLTTEAAEDYTVTAWTPDYLFTNQTAYSQTMTADTFRRVIVWAISSYGCRDTAAIDISLNPIVFIPSAFSPNGDGRNDRFRPINTGAPIFIRFFYVYNRWGQMVYGEQGRNAINGWDGYVKGIPADVGTYYYTIEIEDPFGKTIAQKGDVTLIR